MEGSWLERHGIPNAAVPLIGAVVVGIVLLFCGGLEALGIFSLRQVKLPDLPEPCWAGLGLIGFVVLFFVIGALMGREGEF